MRCHDSQSSRHWLPSNTIVHQYIAPPDRPLGSYPDAHLPRGRPYHSPCMEPTNILHVLMSQIPAEEPVLKNRIPWPTGLAQRKKNKTPNGVVKCPSYTIHVVSPEMQVSGLPGVLEGFLKLFHFLIIEELLAALCHQQSCHVFSAPGPGNFVSWVNGAQHQVKSNNILHIDSCHIKLLSVHGILKTTPNKDQKRLKNT